MENDKIILVTSIYDQADILEYYLEWYLDLGVNFIIAQDLGSSDGSQDVLDRFARSRQLTWFTLPERNSLKYVSGPALATMARGLYDAEWIIQCDADEFLAPQGRDLRSILRDAKKDEFTVLNVACFNMTGPPLGPAQNALQTRTWRIERPITETHEHQLSGEIPVPYIFMRHPPKTIVRASTFVAYGPGTHGATSAWGRNGEVPDLRFLHYPIRGFDKFEKKIRNTTAWLEDNPHLEAEWGWHWRRWIRLAQNGRLRQDYESQFTSPARAQELVRDGVFSKDETISNWINSKQETPCSWRSTTSGSVDRSQPSDDKFSKSEDRPPAGNWGGLELTYPDRLVAPPAWIGHIPFAFWIVAALRPRTIVELGVHSGNSYCAFLQAVQSLGLTAQCFGIDHWPGDDNAGTYGEEVYSELQAYHRPRYGTFSTLVRSTFLDALPYVFDETIDLLHIDGHHTYESVRDDFTSWLPKMSNRGVVLFHDTNVRERDFGVWQLWQEITPRYRNFEFVHSSGLGAAYVGRESLSGPLETLFGAASDAENARIRAYFAQLGTSIIDRFACHEAESEARSIRTTLTSSNRRS